MIGGMGKAGKVLRQVLQTYGISQNKLAIAMGVRSSVVYRWFNELIDPTADTVVNIVTALQKLNPDAAKEFVQLYLGDIVEGKEEIEE
jgi:transcriptional regulator with XRE-family HTH domain